ncbi:MAG: radical SAM protein [Bacteroidales bacterium]|jgi:MoaA/NifB/PqqE/SkfB family radical SAM enzyme|nr:radical SAM protein [Bacteroidales bacterium]MDD4214451.1 radical SAM protein [Bacteroidales bacterium]
MDNIRNIQKYIAEYKSIDYSSIAEKFFTNNEDIIIWKINSVCNFRCKYCTVPSDVDERNFDLNTIKKNFNRDNKKWLIIITGGEPFLKKNFIEIIKTLTENHYVHINTNLSTSNVEEFAKKISPQNVYGLNVAAHVLEREKYDKDFKQFIKNINLLRDKGFSLFISYIFHPEMIERIERDFELFEKGGVNEVVLRPFMGTYKNKVYPNSYTVRGLEILNKYGKQEYELGSTVGIISYKDNWCLAGRRSFMIDEKGIAYRCEPLYKNGNTDSNGNFFDDSFIPDKKIKKCPLEATPCPFQCIFYSKKTHKSFFSFLSHIIK